MTDDLQRHPQAPAPGTELPSHFAYCFGCGSDHPSGLHLRIVAGPGVTMTGRFVVAEEHQGAPGLIHGGVLATAFDEVLGAANWLLMAPAVTGHLEVDFRKPVPVGEVVEIRAQIDSVEGRKVLTSGVGVFTDGTTVAEASGLFIQVPLEHFARHGRARDVAAVADELRVGMELNP
jgi:acyl-coenzyme A thioesterase PaaI-like protein